VGGEHGEAFVQVGIPGRHADAVVESQLLDLGAVEQPTQHQDRLLETAQRPRSGAGPEPLPFGVQQPGHEHHGVVAYGQGRGVCDGSTGAGPLLKLIFGRTTSYRGSASFRCTATGSGVSMLDIRPGYLACSSRYPERLMPSRLRQRYRRTN
jgi:hypothetical protein